MRRAPCGGPIAALAIAVFVLAGCANATAPSSSRSATSSVSLPLAESATTARATWAVVPVAGFWELLRLPSGGSHWSLATPPGVGDQGGLVIGIAPDQALTAGFRPTQLLKFSPFARTSDGSGWTTGVLPGSLVDSPDALSVGSDGLAWAVLTSASGKVVTTSDGGSTWREMVSGRELAESPVGRACGLSAITAVAHLASVGAVVAVSCSRPGAVGVLTSAGVRGIGGWAFSGPRLPRSLNRGQVQVLRLIGGPEGLFVLLAVTTRERDDRELKTVHLIAAWSDLSASTWHESPPLPLGKGSTVGKILSAGTIGSDVAETARLDAAGPAASVLIATSGKLEAEQVSRIAAGWQLLPFTPAKTVTLAEAGNGTLEALAVQGQFIQVWSHGPGVAYWTRIQTVFVPAGGS